VKEMRGGFGVVDVRVVETGLGVGEPAVKVTIGGTSAVFLWLCEAKELGHLLNTAIAELESHPNRTVRSRV